MGLFDKFKFANDPFEDDTERTYYEIVYGLLSSVRNVTPTGIKNYIEFHYGKPCDDDILKTVLKCFDGPRGTGYVKYSSEEIEKFLSYESFSRKKIKGIVALNKELDVSRRYGCEKEKAIEICYKKSFESIKKDYDKVIEVAQNNGLKYYDEGINKLFHKYYSEVGEELFKKLIHDLTVDFYKESNSTVIRILVAELDKALWMRKDEIQVAAVVLRALHFKKSGEKSDGYTSIVDDDCRTFVLNNEWFKGTVAKQPFETEEITEKLTRSIKKSKVFLADVKPPYWMPDNEMEAYYSDKICYQYCEGVIEKYDVVNFEANDIYDVVWTYINEN